MLKKLPLLFLVISTTIAQAQDYVITLRNDTVRGTVDVYSYGPVDRLEVRNGKKKTQFTVMEIREASIGGTIYKGVKGNDGIRIMKLIKPGYVSQYRARTPNSITYDVPYLVKMDGNAIEIPNISFKKMMASFMSDCPAVKSKIESGVYSKKDLEILVNDYNNCIISQTKALLQEPPVSATDPVLVAIDSLKEKISKDNNLKSGKDAIDVLTDISGKVKNKQPVPNYLSEGLKSILKDSPEYQKDLDNLFTLIQKR